MEYYIIIGIGIFCFAAGLWIGNANERNSWLLRASSNDNKGSTAHHCDGKFYYIIEERYFNDTYQLRNTEEIQDRKDKWCEEELKGWVYK